MLYVRVALALLVVFLTGGALADSCGLTITQPGPACSYSSTPCVATTGTVMYPLPQGEDYNSFYSWILGILGTDGASVNTKWVNQTTTDPNIYFKNVSSDTQCYINVTFVYEVASYRNRMGYFKFNKASGAMTSSASLIFGESSVDCQTTGKSCLPPGSTKITIGPFRGNESVGFYLEQNRVCGTYDTFYSVDSLNKQDKRNWKPIPKTGRLVAVLRDPNTQRVYYGFEDAPGGSDQDYNDNVYSLSSSCPLDYTKIPCASTTCRNNLQVIDQETCTCYCPGKATTTCTSPQVYNNDKCACACPNATTTCSGNFDFNSATCQCECPATASAAGVTCTNQQQWDRTSCSCKCPDPASYTCPSNSLFVLNSTTCTCNCPAAAPTSANCTGNRKWNSANNNCSCYCPSTGSCPTNQKWNSSYATCGCYCPATAALAGVTCLAHEQWDTASCSCKCPDTATQAGVTCPNAYYQWDKTNTCDCACPATASAAGATCQGQTQWDTSACNCTCPATGTCTGNLQWYQSSNVSVCGCQCPATGSCSGNYIWNSTNAVCDCFCPYTAPASSPCQGNYVWNRTVCDCFCPIDPPAPCPGVQVWDRDTCTCVCPEDDPCLDQATACKQYQCNGNTGNCDLVYTESCSGQKLQYNTTGCLQWSCDDDLGCVRSANGSCCTRYSNCTECAKADGCDWLGSSCADSGQVLTSPLEPVDHPDCFPSTGLSAGQTAGITVGIVAGVTVGVGGAAALFGAGYVLYRMLNKPPPPEQLPTIENLDTEAGTDDNPLFHKSEVEMTNPMFSAAGAGGGGGGGVSAPAMFAQGGGASAIPDSLHTL
jgi:hypothetical protein